MERSVDDGPRPVVGVRHKVGVGAQGESGVGVTQIIGQGPDGDTTLEQHRGIVMAQSMHSVLTGRFHSYFLKSRLPNPAIDVLTVEQSSLTAGEYEAVSLRVTPESLGDRHCESIGERNLALASTFGWARVGDPLRIFTCLRTTTFRRRKSISSIPSPKVSPWRSPSPAATIGTARYRSG